MSLPKIVLHQNIIKMDFSYKKRTQKDYSLSLKLQIVQEIEQGLLTPMQATTKYGYKQDLRFELG